MCIYQWFFGDQNSPVAKSVVVESKVILATGTV